MRRNEWHMLRFICWKSYHEENVHFLKSFLVQKSTNAVREHKSGGFLDFATNQKDTWRFPWRFQWLKLPQFRISPNSPLLTCQDSTMASPLHRLIPWLRRPVRTCLRSIPISRPWQQGLLYPICTRLMARQGGKMVQWNLVADVLFCHDFYCWWWWFSDRADQYFLFQKDHGLFRHFREKQKATSRKHFDQELFFQDIVVSPQNSVFFFTWVGQKSRCFLGKRVRHFPDPRRKQQGTLPTPSTKPASFSSAIPILRDDLPACSHRSEGGFVSYHWWKPLVVYRLWKYHSVWLASNPHCVSSCCRESKQ